MSLNWHSSGVWGLRIDCSLRFCIGHFQVFDARVKLHETDVWSKMLRRYDMKSYEDTFS